MEVYRMKFLITGIAGFVAPYLARCVIGDGHEVYGLLHTTSSKMSNIENIKYLTGDLTRPDTLGHLKAHNFDGVFHLAGLTHPPTSFKEPRLYFEANALGTINLCQAIGKGSMIMQCSTPEVYGVCPDHEISEAFTMQPMNPYGVAKAAADLYILERTRNNKLRAFITRAGSHTGAGRPSCYSISSDASQIAKIKKGLQQPILRVGNMNSYRALMDVRDVVVAYYKLMMKYLTEELNNGDIYHISGLSLHPIEFYVDFMIKLAGVKVSKAVDEKLLRKVDIPYQNLNSEKIEGILSWKPKISIEETLNSVLDYWEEVIDGL